MLAAFGFAGGAAGVHEEERCFGVLGNGLDNLASVILQDIVHKVVAVHNHGRFRAEVACVAAPEEHFVDVLPFFFCGGYGDVGAGFVIHPLAIAMITIGINQNAAAGI